MASSSSISPSLIILCAIDSSISDVSWLTPVSCSAENRKRRTTFGDAPRSTIAWSSKDVSVSALPSSSSEYFASKSSVESDEVSMFTLFFL